MPNCLKDKFNSHEQDKTGLMYFNARYYDPDTGRFAQADPTVPDPDKSQSFNRYMFVYGNPISFVDMEGYQADYNSWNKMSQIMQQANEEFSLDQEAFTYEPSAAEGYNYRVNDRGPGFKRSGNKDTVDAAGQPIDSDHYTNYATAAWFTRASRDFFAKTGKYTWPDDFSSPTGQVGLDDGDGGSHHEEPRKIDMKWATIDNRQPFNGNFDEDANYDPDATVEMLITFIETKPPNTRITIYFNDTDVRDEVNEYIENNNLQEEALIQEKDGHKHHIHIEWSWTNNNTANTNTSGTGNNGNNTGNDADDGRDK